MRRYLSSKQMKSMSQDEIDDWGDQEYTRRREEEVCDQPDEDNDIIEEKEDDI